MGNFYVYQSIYMHLYVYTFIRNGYVRKSISKSKDYIKKVQVYYR